MLWVDLFIIWLLEDYSGISPIPLTHNVNGENNAELYVEVVYGEMKWGWGGGVGGILNHLDF